MAFNGPGDAGVAFSIFRRKKKKKRKSNCSLIGRRLLTNGDVQTLIEKNPLKKVRLLPEKNRDWKLQWGDISLFDPGDVGKN